MPWCESFFIRCPGHLVSPFHVETNVLQFRAIFCIINLIIPFLPFLCFLFSGLFISWILDLLEYLYFLFFLFCFPSHFYSTFWQIALTLYDTSFIQFLKFLLSYFRFQKYFSSFEL